MANQVLMPNQTTHGHPRNGFWKNLGCTFFIVGVAPSCFDESAELLKILQARNSTTKLQVDISVPSFPLLLVVVYTHV